MSLVTSLIGLLVVGAVLFAITSVLAWASWRTSNGHRQLLGELGKVPESMVLVGDGKRVWVKESGPQVPVWEGQPSWEGDRTVGVLKSKLRRRIATGFLVTELVCVAIAVAAFVFSPWLLFAYIFVVAEQVYPFWIGPDLLGTAEDSVFS